MTTKAEFQSDKDRTNLFTLGANSTDERYGHEQFAPKFPRRKLLVMDLYSLLVASYLKKCYGNWHHRECHGKIVTIEIVLRIY